MNSLAANQQFDSPQNRPPQSDSPLPKRQLRTARPIWPWQLAAAISCAIIGISSGYYGVFQPGPWPLTVALVVCAVTAGQALVRTMRAPSGLVFLAGVLVLGEVLSLRFLPSTMLFAVIPTGATVDGALDQLEQAARITSTQVVPVDGDGATLFVLCLAAGLVALLMDILIVNLRAPGFSGIGLLTLAITPAVLKPESVGVVGFLIAGIGYILVLIVGRKINDVDAAPWRSGWLLGASCAALAFALALSATIPGFTTGTFPQGARHNPFNQATGVSPVLRLGESLRSSQAQNLLTYGSTANDPPYIRLATVENFSTDELRPSERDDTFALSPSQEIPDPSAPSAPQSTERVQFIQTQIRANNLTSQYVPAPAAAVQVRGLGNGDWQVDPLTLSIKGSDGDDILGKTYEVVSRVGRFTASDLQNSPPISAGMVDGSFTRVPRNVPQSITTTTEQVLSGARSPYEKAVALQNYFRNTTFQYSVQAPLNDGYDNTSMNALARFLVTKEGYCIHFSTAMALMARISGIPSRVAIGFLPGRSTGQTVTIAGRDYPQYTVDGTMAHAWPELYFAGYGWVPFEPTTSLGVVPEYSRPQSSGSTDEPSPTVAPEPSPSTQASEATPSSTPTAEASGSKPEQQPFNAWPLMLATLAVVLFLPGLWRSVQRRRRLAASAPIADAWHELVDTAVDSGVRIPPGRSVRTIATAINERTGSDISTLRDVIERAAYGPDPSAETEQDLQQARAQAKHATAELRRRLPRAIRVLSWLAPASLLRSLAVAVKRGKTVRSN